MRVDAPPTRAGTMPGARRLPDVVLVAICATFAMIVVWAVVREPTRVESIQFTNSTPYRLTIDARTIDGDGTVRIGSIARGATIQFNETIDKGDRWLLSFSYAGYSADDVQVDRAALEQGWEIPPEVGEDLTALGLVASDDQQAAGSGDDPG